MPRKVAAAKVVRNPQKAKPAHWMQISMRQEIAWATWFRRGQTAAARLREGMGADAMLHCSKGQQGSAGMIGAAPGGSNDRSIDG
jgi:hypothetical protein